MRRSAFSKPPVKILSWCSVEISSVFRWERSSLTCSLYSLHIKSTSIILGTTHLFSHLWSLSFKSTVEVFEWGLALTRCIHIINPLRSSHTNWHKHLHCQAGKLNPYTHSHTPVLLKSCVLPCLSIQVAPGKPWVALTHLPSPCRGICNPWPTHYCQFTSRNLPPSRWLCHPGLVWHQPGSWVTTEVTTGQGKFLCPRITRMETAEREGGWRKSRLSAQQQFIQKPFRDGKEMALPPLHLLIIQCLCLLPAKRFF